MFRDARVPKGTATNFRASLKKALSSSKREHLLSESELASYVAERSATVPTCLEGLEACISSEAIVFSQLGINAVVRVELATHETGLEASYQLVDGRGDVIEESTVTDEKASDLAFSLVRDLFDATGTVAIKSEPSDAAVRIDGETVGTTPFESRLPIGKHTFTIQHPGRENVEGSFELASGESKTVRHELPERPGSMVIRNAPERARVMLDGEEAGNVGETLSVEPGKHALKVTAKGYEPYEESISIESGELLQRSVPLERKSQLLQDVTADEIAVNHYVARLTYDHSIHPTTFRDARGTVDGTEYEFQGFADDSGALPPNDVVRRTLAPNGLRLDVSYTGRHFGVIFLGVSYLATKMKRQAFLDSSTQPSDSFTARVTAMRRLQLRPLQVSFRYFFDNFVPSIEVGTGLTFQWLNVDQIPDVPEMTLHQTEAFWNIGLTGQYFVNSNWFGLFRYSVQDYFNRGKGVEHMFSIGVGAAYPNLFGIEPEPPEEL